jgi:ABC-2 type transport system permease protein
MSSVQVQPGGVPLGSAVAPVGREVKGPTALGDDPRRLGRLAFTLASTDFKLKFFGSFLGYLWQLINPLLLFGVLFVVFSFALSLDQGVSYFPVALLMGIVLFSFLSEATTAAVRSLVQRENLVRKVDFPRLAVPMASVMTAMFNLGLNLLPVLVFLLASGGRPRAAWLGFVVVIAVLVIFVFGLSMLLSIAFVRFRDIEPIWSVVLQVLFYTSGVFFTVDAIAGQKHGQLFVDLLFCNPFAAILAAARHSLVDPSWEAPWQAVSNDWLLLVPGALIVGSVVFGFLLFRAQAPRVAEDL